MQESPRIEKIEEKPKHSEPLPGRCNARTRGGGYCWSWPTKSNGKRCRMHGGASGSGRPVISGRYSKVLKKSLRTKYRVFLKDEDYRDLRFEVCLQRALLSEYLGRFNGSGARLRAEDISRLFDWTDKIGRMIERVARIENQTALTAREVQLLESLIINLLIDYLPEKSRAEFGERLSAALGSEGLLPAPQQMEVIDHARID